MTVSAEYASEHLSELLSAVDRGEAVDITRGSLPAVRLSVNTQGVQPGGIRPRSELFGSLEGQIWMAEDWDSPEQNAEIAADFLDSDEDEDFLLGRTPSK